MCQTARGIAKGGKLCLHAVSVYIFYSDRRYYTAREDGQRLSDRLELSQSFQIKFVCKLSRTYLILSPHAHSPPSKNGCQYVALPQHQTLTDPTHPESNNFFRRVVLLPCCSHGYLAMYGSERLLSRWH